MQAFILIVFTSVMLGPYAVSLGAPKFLDYAPDLMSVLALPYVALEGSRRGFPGVDTKYWLTFGAITLVILGGLFANGTGSVPLIYGLRFYLRALPFFFIPAIYEFSDAEMQQQLNWLLFLGFLQFPVSVYQRWLVWSQGKFSGDTIQGTLLDSGTESIFLICSALILTTIYLRGYIKKQPFFILLLLLLFPTCINETKVTAIFVPIGFTIALMVGTERRRRVRTLLGLIALLLGFAALFVPVYNLMEANNPYKNERSGIVAFFSDQKELGTYMSSDVKGVGTKKQVRRGDAISVPLKMLTEDPVHLALGLGVGSTSPPTYGANSGGNYYAMFRQFLLMSFTYFILEIGALGICLLMVLYWLIYRDSLFVSHEQGLVGAIACGWSAVTVLLCMSLVYTNIHLFPCLSYLFWYFSGLIAAQRARITGRSAEPVGVLAASGRRNLAANSSAARVMGRH